MNKINEKIGYIEQQQFNLKYVIENITKTLCDKNGIKWSDSYEIKGKINNKDKEGFQYLSFLFDLNNKKLGYIKIIIVNIINPKVTSYKFDGFINEEDAMFYSPVDSITDKKKNNVGVIYISYNAFKEYCNNIKKLQEEITPFLYHELRHYYDNIIGVFNGSIKELLHITLIADELNINVSSYIEQLRNKGEKYDNLKQLLYVSEPTELNAFYHSFVSILMDYSKKNSNLTKDDIIKYIKERGNVNASCPEFYIYNYSIVYQSLANYKKVINMLCKEDPVKLYYYIHRTLVACQSSDETLKRLNTLFEKKYLNYFTDKINDKIFGKKLSEFINNHYMKYVYNKIAKKYLHTVNNMNKFISTII